MNTQPMNPPNEPQSTAPRPVRYKGGRQTTTLVLSKNLVAASREYFPQTTHASLSAFLDKQLAAFFRRNARKIRKAGVTVPPEIFEK